MKKSDQRDAGLAFDGMAGTGVNRMSGTSHCANPYSLGDKALSMNKGRGPTKGNASSSPMMVGPSATKDPKKMTIATAKGGKINGGRAWDPQAGQNYKGNPDKINVGMK